MRPLGGHVPGPKYRGPRPVDLGLPRKGRYLPTPESQNTVYRDGRRERVMRSVLHLLIRAGRPTGTGHLEGLEDADVLAIEQRRYRCEKACYVGRKEVFIE